MLDKAVSKLLLRPTPSDVSLDSVLVLLLYAQWMPCNWGNESDQSTTSTGATGQPNSRYNEVSAWAVLGLALRYSLLLGLDRAAIAPFHGPIDSITESDVCRLRVWYNLLNCDFNLMLISGLPASVDPAPSAQVAGRFASSTYSKHPGDIRVSGLVELVSIVHRAMQSCGDISGHQLSPSCLRKLNIDLGKWERCVTALRSIFSSILTTSRIEPGICGYVRAHVCKSEKYLSTNIAQGIPNRSTTNFRSIPFE